jgi:outer membrane protein W
MKSLFKCFALVGLFAIAAPPAASAQAKRGDKEIQVAGNVFSVLSSGSSMTNGQFQFGIGYFLSDRFELAFTPILSITGSRQTFGSTSAASVTADLGVSTKGQFFFGGAESKVKPYVGGTFIVQSFKTSTGGSIADNTYIGSNVGVKNYFTQRAALDMNTSFGFRPNAPGDFQLLQFNIGITYVF